MSNTPKIRFSGFTEDWEQRKVKDISDFIDGNYGEKYPRDDEFIDSGIPFFTSAVTGSEGIFNEKNVKFISTEKNRELTKAQSQGGDLILTNRGASMGVIAEIPEKYGLVNIGPQLTRIRGKENEANNKYLLCLFQTSTNNKKLTSMNAGSAMPFIGLKGLGNIDLLIPQYDEQLKIGEYFSCLDNLITLHQCKYDDTKLLKKYMLQKMFPQNGQKVPEIRFSGFTGDWEQRKLGELVGIYDGVHQTPDYQDSGIMFLSVENIATLKSEKYISEEAFERNYKVYPEKGDILMTRIGDVGTTNVVETTEKVAFYVSLALLKPNGINSYFLSNAMKTNAFQKGLRERTLVTAIPQKINKDEIGKIDIFITKNDEEQKKIGAYFSNLDHLITLHQRKCDELKELKKYMLQNMFPQKG